MKICFIRHEDVVKVVVIQSVQQKLIAFRFTVPWSFIAWTITNIRRTVRSDILNAMAFQLADRRGFLTKAWRTRSMSSGVLSEGSLLGGFLFAADAVSLKFLTHSSRVLQLGTLSFRWILKCRRHIRWVRTLFLKYVSTAKARCSTDQRSMATEMLWVSLEARWKTTSPHEQFHSQLCCQIVRYFCRTLYIAVSSLYLYKCTDRCHRVETQLQ
jgi:hypothetical protein